MPETEPHPLWTGSGTPAWLGCFLWFREKHAIAHENSERLWLFPGKLREKGQGERQRHRAARVVSLCFMKDSSVVRVIIALAWNPPLMTRG
jgi:hypothetical protein